MTVLRPGLREQTRVADLGDTDRAAVQRLLDADPIVNAVVAARVRAARSLAARRLGGAMLGLRTGRDLVAGCYSGGNLIPFGGAPDALVTLAQEAGRRDRVCTSIVGRAEAVTAMWSVLAPAWGPARAIRPEQPLLVADRPSAAPCDESVRPAHPADLERYLAAASAMFAEELGVSPSVATGTSPFRSRIADLISYGRAFASFDFRGQVTFKADIGAVSAHTCQIQGVWVRPDLRGRGIATAGLAAVLRHGLTLAPTVSLYVNDFNLAARRVYAKLGMRQHATLATVLL